jgi:methyltransferase (TIGR00027 family)
MLARSPENSRTRRRSRIAGANAWFRGQEHLHPASLRILDDPWAAALADRAPELLAIRGLAVLLPDLRATLSNLLVAHCVRHRAVDELVVQAIARDGLRQIVVIGAGYDMRASRFGPRFAGVRWIEIDDAATQARKCQRLAGRQDVIPVVRVAAELEDEPLSAILGRTGFDPELPTCFVLEGLVHYLSPAALDAVLAGTALCRAETRIVLTFIEQEMRTRASGRLVQLFRAMGEAPQTFWSLPAMATRLSAHGFVGPDSWDFEQQRNSFVPPQVFAQRRLEARWWQRVLRSDRA